MLRKRNRSVQKDQHMGESHAQSDIWGIKHRTNSIFSIPGVFVSFNPKAPSDSDAVRSPTSPLDFRVFSNLGKSFRSQRNPNDMQQRSWDCNKVGLSIIDSLDDGRTDKVLRSSDSKTILFGSEMRIRTPNTNTHTNSFDTPNSVPKNCAIFPVTRVKPSHIQKGNSNVVFEIETFGKIQSCSLDSGRSLLTRNGSAERSSSMLSSGIFTVRNEGSLSRSASPAIEGRVNIGDQLDTKVASDPIPTHAEGGLIGSLSASEIELSEDYTRVTSHGPNPKTTHIFGDRILECHSEDVPPLGKNDELLVGCAEVQKRSGILSSFPSNDFLSFCHYCKKKLEGKDIYMYRGEKAFCSLGCRSDQIEEEMEKSSKESAETSPGKDSSEEPLAGMFIAV